MVVQPLTGCAFGLEVTHLELRWLDHPHPIVALIWGAAELDDEQWRTVSDLSEPMWPGWRSDGYCVPSAKPAPCQSFFRRWDPGRAVWPLGSFGPSLGTPYAAAFPRPLYAAAMGSDDRGGWVVLGAGAIPDGAMTIELKASTAWMRWNLREDLWGAPEGLVRRWEAPLRLTCGATAYDAWQAYFDSFPRRTPSPASTLHSTWNTWGNFMLGRFDLEQDLATARKLNAEHICIDDYWETFVSSGKTDYERFPRFDQQVQEIRDAGLSIGFWQAVGWVAHPQRCGLSDEDLLVGKDGRPRRANWAMNPFESGEHRYCLDPSSPGTIRFLRERTRQIIDTYRPALLKLDFAYGLPSPDVAAPRDPAWRGERMGHRLTQIIADQAREMDPDIVIEGFTIHPLWEGLINLVALDDQGDSAGKLNPSFEVDCHRQWSVWASLCGPRGQAVNGSSGYAVEADPEAALNSLVLGGTGSIQPADGYDRGDAGALATRVRQAAHRWSRRTTTWRPAWFNSDIGRLGHEPQTRCWGRLEQTKSDTWVLTTLVLRPGGPEPVLPEYVQSYNGRWALVGQDDHDLADSKRLIVIPADLDATITLSWPLAVNVQPVDEDGNCIGPPTTHERPFTLATQAADLEAQAVAWLLTRPSSSNA